MRRDLVFGSATLALGSLYYWLAGSVAVSRLADPIGPQGLPKIYGMALMTLSLVLIVSSTRSAVRSQSPEPRAQSHLYRAAGMLMIGIAYVVVVPYAGYMVMIAAVILATIYYQGGRFTRHAVLVSLFGGVFFWVLFVVLMGIDQPRGFFPPGL